VFEEILRQMRESLRKRNHIITEHAQEKMEERGLTFYDIERAVFSGHIRAHQRDYLVRETKYIIVGQAYRVDYIEVVAKMTRTGRLVIITVYPV
jgi:uncharacterized DUF497 family protein